MAVIRSVLSTYKAFGIVTGLVLFLLLVRIPLGTFNNSSSIDTVAHFLLPASAAPLLYEILRRYKYLGAPNQRALLLTIILIGIACETLWEIVEFSTDATFGTKWQLSNTDTMHDIISSVIGTPLGAYLFIRSARPLKTD